MPLAYPPGALSRILGRCQGVRRHDYGDPAADRAALRWKIRDRFSGIAHRASGKTLSRYRARILAGAAEWRSALRRVLGENAARWSDGRHRISSQASFIEIRNRRAISRRPPART